MTALFDIWLKTDVCSIVKISDMSDSKQDSKVQFSALDKGDVVLTTRLPTFVFFITITQLVLN